MEFGITVQLIVDAIDARQAQDFVERMIKETRLRIKFDMITEVTKLEEAPIPPAPKEVDKHE